MTCPKCTSDRVSTSERFGRQLAVKVGGSGLIKAATAGGFAAGGPLGAIVVLLGTTAVVAPATMVASMIVAEAGNRHKCRDCGCRF